MSASAYTLASARVLNSLRLVLAWKKKKTIGNSNRLKHDAMYSLMAAEK